MHFARAGLSQHRNDLAQSCAPDQRILDQDHPFSAQQADYRIELDLDAEMTNGLARLDKSTADIVAAHQTHLKWQAGFFGVAECGSVAGVRHRDNDVCVSRTFARECAALRLADLVNVAAVKQTV